MRRLGWLAVGVVVLLGLGLATRDGSGRIGPRPTASGSGAPRSEAGERIAGPVTHVRDGHTVKLGSVTVRIANLDCTERDTSEGQAASARIRELVGGQEVACELEVRRSYDLEVGPCALASSGEDLGEVLMPEGGCGR